MNSPQTEPAKPKSTDGNPSPKATLADFIEENSKLVTSIAAFIALTAFASQIDYSEVKLYFSALTFLAAVLLTLELLAKFPARPYQWRLEAFSFILTPLVALMGWFWFSKFPGVWIPQVAAVCQMVVFLGLGGLLTYFFTKAIRFVSTHVLKRELESDAMRRANQIVFLVSTAVVLVGVLWASRKLGGHPIKIHIPFF